MPPALEFTVHGTAQPKGSTRAFIPKGWTRPIITSTNRSLKGWEQTVRAELQRVMAETDQALLMALFDAPIALTFVFHLPRPKSAKRGALPMTRPDLDKVARSTIDALSTVLFRDDARVVELHARKVYASVAAKVDIRIEAAAPANVAPIEGSLLLEA